MFLWSFLCFKSSLQNCSVDYNTSPDFISSGGGEEDWVVHIWLNCSFKVRSVNQLIVSVGETCRLSFISRWTLLSVYRHVTKRRTTESAELHSNPQRENMKNILKSLCRCVCVCVRLISTQLALLFLDSANRIPPTTPLPACTAQSTHTHTHTLMKPHVCRHVPTHTAVTLPVCPPAVLTAAAATSPELPW